VCEFRGCFWHGHTCLPFRDVTTVAGETLAERYEHTMARIGQITRAAYEIEFMCECDFDVRILARHPELKTRPVVQHSPLNTRDALYGGSNEGHGTALQDTRGETIRYCDMSLYTHSCKYFKFPQGHPVIHVGDACQDIEIVLQKDGLIKCTILPPKRLYHPVLPFRCNNKLLFFLCKSCATELNVGSECMHDTIEQRALVGTWLLMRLNWLSEKDMR